MFTCPNCGKVNEHELDPDFLTCWNCGVTFETSNNRRQVIIGDENGSSS